MSWLGSLQDLGNNSGQSELLEESLKNKLRTLKKDERQSSEDESFELPPVLFRRPISKTDTRRSYIHRIIDNYRKKKDIAENEEKKKISTENSRPSNFNRISSTPFHITDAKLPTEESLILSPIYSHNKSNQGNCLAQAENTKEVIDTKPHRENDNAKVSEKKNKSKKTKAIGNDTKNTSIIKKAVVKRHTKSYATTKTKKCPSITKRLSKSNAGNNGVLTKNNMITYTTLNPDRRRTFVDQSHVYLNDKAFGLDEDLECDPLPQVINYCEEMDHICKPPLKNKVRILENILITNTGKGSKVKQPVLSEYNNTPIDKKHINSGNIFQSSFKRGSKHRLKSSNTSRCHPTMKTRSRVLASQNESPKKKYESIAMPEDKGTTSRKRSVNKIPNQSLSEISANLSNIENIDPHLNGVSPAKKTSVDVSNLNSALDKSMKKSIIEEPNEKQRHNPKASVDSTRRTLVVKVCRLSLIEKKLKIAKDIRGEVNSAHVFPTVEDDSPKETVNGLNVHESDKQKRILRKGVNVDYNPVKKRRGRPRKQEKKQELEQIDDPILRDGDILNEGLNLKELEAANDSSVRYTDKPIDEEMSQESEPFGESVKKSEGRPIQKKLGKVDASNQKRRGRSKKDLKLTANSRMTRRVARKIKEMSEDSDPPLASIRKLGNESMSQQLKHIVDTIRTSQDEELLAAYNSTERQIEGEISQGLDPIANSFQEHSIKVTENPKTDSLKSNEDALINLRDTQMIESIQKRSTKSIVKSQQLVLELETIRDSKQKRQRRSEEDPKSEELKAIKDTDLSQRGRPVVEVISQNLEPTGDLVKRRRGRPRKVQPSRKTSKSDDTETMLNEDCFIKPIRSPNKKAMTRDQSVSTTYLQELSENVDSFKKPIGRPRKSRAVKQIPVQVEVITTSSSIEISHNSTTNNSIRISARNRPLNPFFNKWYSGHDETKLLKNSGSRLSSRTISLPKKRLSTIAKKKEKTKKVVRKGCDLKTIFEESQLLKERHNINLELENNDNNHNNLKIVEETNTDSTQLKDSGLPTDSQDSNLLTLTSDYTNNDGVTATTKSSVFAPRENAYKHFIFDLQKDTTNDSNPFITLPIPKDVESKIGRIIMKPGYRKPNITLKNFNLTLYVSSGTGIYTLQNQSARLSKDIIVKAYDGNEYSIFNDGAKELNLVYFTYPSKKEGS